MIIIKYNNYHLMEPPVIKNLELDQRVSVGKILLTRILLPQICLSILNVLIVLMHNDLACLKNPLINLSTWSFVLLFVNIFYTIFQIVIKINPHYLTDYLISILIVVQYPVFIFLWNIYGILAIILDSSTCSNVIIPLRLVTTIILIYQWIAAFYIFGKKSH